MTNPKTHAKLLVTLLIVVIITYNYCNIPVTKVVPIHRKNWTYVYKFSSHFEPFPGIYTSKVPATCLPPGTATTQSAGRLGNIILEYVSLWALARIYNLTAFVPDVMYSRLSEVFSSLSISSEDQFKKSNSKCTPRKYQLVFESLAKINLEEETLERTVERTFRYRKAIVLQRCVILVEAIVPLAAEIKRNFIYHHRYSVVAHEILSTVKTRIIESRPRIKEVVFIGVHVRRTDYAGQLVLLYNSKRPADEGYYGRAIQRLRSHVLSSWGDDKETVQIVTSDDPEWVRSTLLPHLDKIGLRHTYFAGNGDLKSPEHDLALLSHCNHSVFAYGTYGMWTALWAGGRAVVYDLDQGDAVSPAMQFARNLPLWEAIK